MFQVLLKGSLSRSLWFTIKNTRTAIGATLSKEIIVIGIHWFDKETFSIYLISDLLPSSNPESFLIMIRLNIWTRDGRKASLIEAMNALNIILYFMSSILLWYFLNLNNSKLIIFIAKSNIKQLKKKSNIFSWYSALILIFRYFSMYLRIFSVYYSGIISNFATSSSFLIVDL